MKSVSYALSSKKKKLVNFLLKLAMLKKSEHKERANIRILKTCTLRSNIYLANETEKKRQQQHVREKKAKKMRGINK